MKNRFLVFLLLFSLYGCNSVKENRIVENICEPSQENCIVKTIPFEAKTNFIHGKTFSIMFWVKPESAYMNTTLFSIETENGYLLLAISENSSGNRTGLNLSTKEEKVVSNFEDSHLYMNQWNQIAITRSDKKYCIYLNGILLAEGNLNVDYYTTSNIVFGKTSFYDDPSFEGLISNIEISNYVLSDEEILNTYNEMMPKYYLETWKVEYSDNRIENILLPDSPYRGMNITYSSSNEEIIEIDGLVHRPSKEIGTQHVDFTINIESSNELHSKTVEIIVPHEDESIVENSYDEILNQIGYIVNDKQKLPEMTSNRERIIWSSNDVKIDNYTVIKQSSIEKLPAVLHAEIETTDGIIKLDLKVVVLDEYAGYLLTYFDGEEGNEVGKVLYSYDGLHWSSFDCDPILKSEIGTGRVRDPFISRDIDGNFLITATQGYDNPDIYFWKSEDLIELYDHKLIKVTDQNIDLELTGERAWAPEIVFDPISKEYLIFFSDPKGGNHAGIYVTRTSDFETFTYPNTYYDFDYKTIDASLIQYQSGYLMFYKDEREGAKTVFYAYIGNLLKGIQKVEDDKFISLIKNIEGPFAFKLNGKDKYLLYADNYPNAKFIVWEFSDIATDLRQLEEIEYSLPQHVRHGSVISVTKKELDRLLDYYSD